MIKLKTTIPGPKSSTILRKMQKINGGWSDPLPFVHSHKGKGCYFKDIDGNKFLDFASQIAANPLGYNHKRLLKVVKKYKHFPIKYAGQDFYTKEHLEMIEEVLSITKGKNAAFLVNSGAEAVENAIKVSMLNQKSAKFGISFQGGFHGRTLGALSCTNSQAVHKNRFPQLPMRRLPYDHNAIKELKRILEQEARPEDIGFIIIEPIQGEGGYRIPNHTMMKELSLFCKRKRIPLIADEVQAGLGRTGKWWAHQHFEFDPTVISSAKALQVGAVISTKNFFPEEPGTISSTWGGGNVLDLAIGRETIRIIKDQKLLKHNQKMGEYLLQQVNTLPVQNVRGLGLMCAFDVPTTKMRNNLVLQLIKQGVAILACGTNGIRMIPPYIVTEKQIDEFIIQLDKAIKKCEIKGFKHKGKVCEFTGC
jgi:4-aminobutyrate aminotransferase